jgi:hypothetical protein
MVDEAVKAVLMMRFGAQAGNENHRAQLSRHPKQTRVNTQENARNGQPADVTLVLTLPKFCLLSTRSLMRESCGITCRGEPSPS